MSQVSQWVSDKGLWHFFNLQFYLQFCTFSQTTCFFPAIIGDITSSQSPLAHMQWQFKSNHLNYPHINPLQWSASCISAQYVGFLQGVHILKRDYGTFLTHKFWVTLYIRWKRTSWTIRTRSDSFQESHCFGMVSQEEARSQTYWDVGWFWKENQEH